MAANMSSRAGCTVLLLLQLAAIASSLAGCDSSLDVPHLALTKSFSRALQDCMEYLQVPGYRYAEYASNHYPDDPETKCLLRCVGLNLRWWNDTTGVQPAIMKRFFQPDPADAEYKNRTAECLEKELPGGDDADCCCSAYESFRCYLQYYGNLLPCALFYPEDDSRHVHAAQDCIEFLQIPEKLLRSYGAGSFPDAPETRCLLRCFFLRTGVFHVESGFDVVRLYSRDFESPDERYLAPETQTKLHELRGSVGEQCTEVYVAYRDVLGELGRPFFEYDVLQKAAQRALGLAQEETPVTTTTVCPSISDYNYKELNCQNCGRLLITPTGRITCARCMKNSSPFGKFFF
ncbi:general odorant-binding protein 69-like [Anopheles stephensi]|uniref:general odorant-binding protein 69-like n=1 Tax=Anopheles stephensi TaxID=30069 RepID=UPI0016588D11|nr:general odorant-binding protein 69-like [Anopheles stephensi]